MNHWKKRKMKKKTRVCDDTCDNCIYIGEGDFICDKKSELVIENWFPVFGYCLLEDSILSEDKNA